jgi:hypothetical protein
LGKRKITWGEIYKEFRRTFPTHAKKAVHYEPDGFLKIVIFMDDGTKITYDYFYKQLKFCVDGWKKQG